MNQFDSVLRMYAESGLRTSEDWITLGRDIQSGVKSRLDAPLRGEVVPLYSRDQTRHRPRAQSRRDEEQNSAVAPKKTVALPKH